MASKYLISIPCCGSQHLASIFAHSNDGKTDSTTPSSFKPKVTKSPSDRLIKLVPHQDINNLIARQRIEAVGVVLTDPVKRLKLAYNNDKKTKKSNISFEEYYRHPARLNIYNQLLKKFTLEAFGFIGIQDEFIRGLFLAQQWLDIQLPRVPYSSIPKDNQLTDISKQQEQEIHELHAEDIALYETAKAIFWARWEKLLSSSQFKIPSDKNVIIHIGPPKTGTSAIQHWLTQNTKMLKENSILYPEHRFDNNYISSGNFEKLITFNKDTGHHYFDPIKTKKLLQKFAVATEKTLLLSSEHFFYYLPWLFAFLPKASYIFYVRHPLSILESSFHQEVKRHRRTSSFKLPDVVGFQQLDIITRIARKFSPKLHFRYYDKALYAGGTLINDFSEALPIQPIPKVAERHINSKYSPGALELMRLCNTFASTGLLHKLDLWLQRYSEGKSSYSLITQQQAKLRETAILRQVDRLSQSVDSLDKVAMYALVTNYQPQKEILQEEVNEELIKIIRALKKNDKTLARLVFDELKTQNDPGLTLLANHFVFSLNETLRYYLKRLLIVRQTK